MSAPWAYVAGLLTLPAIVAGGALVDHLRHGPWATPMALCRHGGPSKDAGHWRVSWRCDEPVGDDERSCGALWVRTYVKRALPRRWLWPHEHREAAR